MERKYSYKQMPLHRSRELLAGSGYCIAAITDIKQAGLAKYKPEQSEQVDGKLLTICRC